MSVFKIHIYLILLLSGNLLFGQEPNDCINYLQVCGNQDINLDVNGWGNIQEVSGCFSMENNSLWIKIDIATSGTLGFVLTPASSSLGEDYDFWVYGPNVSCNNLGSAIRCSTTNPINANLTYNTTGMSQNAQGNFEGNGANGDSFVHWLNVTVGQSYFIVIDRPHGNSAFNLTWNGSAQINNPFLNLPQPFNEIDVLQLCDGDNNGIASIDFSTLDANFLNGNVGFSNTYYSNLDDANSGENPLTGVVDVTEGTYYIRTLDELLGCVEIQPFTIEFAGLTLQPATFGACDNDGDGEEIVDLSTFSITVNPIVDFTLTYYATENDALNSINSINPIQQLAVGSHMFYVRADEVGGSCTGVGTITIIVTEPIVVQNNSIELCDTDFDQKLNVNLSDYINLLEVSDNYTLVKYYTSLNDAQNGINPITNSSAYQVSDGQTIYYSFENEYCSSVAEMVFTISIRPQVEDFSIDICDDNDDGFEDVDLSTFSYVEMPNTGVTITFFNSLNDAENNINPINPIMNLPVGNHTFYLRAKYISDLCTSTSTINVGIRSNIQLQSLDLEYCDEDNDGFYTIDLSTFNVDLSISNNYLEVHYFPTMADAQNFTNEILNFTNYNFQDNETIYYRFSNESCVNYTSVHFNLYYYPNLENLSLNFCDQDGDGNYSINLQTEIDYNIRPAGNAFFLSFYNTLNDANNESNTINPNVNAVTGQNIYYVRVNTTHDICYNTAEVDINIQLPIELSGVNSFEFCDDDYDGLYRVDLSSFNDEILASSNVTGFDYYLSLANAQNNENPISDFQNFDVLNGLTVYFKFYNESCDIIVPVRFTVFPKPNLGEDEEIEFCPEQAPIILSVDIGYSQYIWSHDASETGPIVEVSAPGDYTVTVTNQYGCRDEKTFVLNYLDFPTIQNVSVNEGNATVNGQGQPPLYFSIDGGVTWQNSNQFFDLEPGVYHVIIKREEGCISEPVKFIVIHIPNAFTPNADGINDTWNIPFLEEYGTAQIAIYDRYGKMIYQDIVQSLFQWDGKYEGRALPSTAYWYQIILPGQNNLQGWVLLKNRNSLN